MSLEYESPPAEVGPEQIRELGHALESTIAKAVVGQAEVVRQTLVALFAGGHVLLEGVPGLGKTLLVRSLGQVLRMQFSRIQFTPDLMPADCTGTNIIGERRAWTAQLPFPSGAAVCQSRARG